MAGWYLAAGTAVDVRNCFLDNIGTKKRARFLCWRVSIF